MSQASAIRFSREAVRRANLRNVENTLRLAIGVASLFAILFMLTLI